MQSKRVTIGRILHKISLFHRLSPSQLQSFIKLCKTKRYSTDEVIYEIGEHSDSMQILLTGEFQVISDDGTAVAALKPVTTVGEMGMLLNHPRSAQVKASMESSGLHIDRQPFELLMNSDTQFKAQFFNNVVDSLSEKILDNNLQTLTHTDNQTNSVIDNYILRKQLHHALSVIEDRTDLTRADMQDQFEEKQLHEVVILFVDDEESVLSSVERLLRQQACVLQFADGGEQALEILERLKVDIVITDIKMAPMDGPTLAKEIEEKYPGLPVVALSAIVSDPETDSYNFSGYINKPIDLGDFRTLMSDILVEEE